MSLGTAEKSIKNSVSLDLVSYDIPECGATAQFSVVQLESGALLPTELQLERRVELS